MSPPILYSLDAEECLVAALLLSDDALVALDYFSDEDLWYDHLRPVTAAVRALKGMGKPCGLVFVCYYLEPKIDQLAWNGDTGEVMLTELLNRRMFDTQIFYAPALAGLVHFYAGRRKAIKSGSAAALRAYKAVLESAGVEPVSGEGFIDAD